MFFQWYFFLNKIFKSKRTQKCYQLKIKPLQKINFKNLRSQITTLKFVAK